MVELLLRDDEPAFVPDVYFGRGYGRADARCHGGTWMTITDPSGTWQMPMVLIDLGDGLREAISPYGYSGIYVAEGLTTEDAARAWDTACQLLRDLGVVSLFLRFSPLDPSSMNMAEDFTGLTMRRSRTTYVLTTDELDRLWATLKSSCRSRIRKARKNGYSGVVRPATGADLVAGSDFRRLYEQTMARRNADSFYYFTGDYHAELLAGLGSDLLVVEVRDPAGVVVSAATLLRHAQLLHYHHAGSSPEGAQMGSNNLMLWTAAEFAIEQGLDRFHLGGGLNESDGLARFKSTFGSETNDFHTGRVVVDAAAYSELTTARASELGATVTALEESEYFPAFRVSRPVL